MNISLQSTFEEIAYYQGAKNAEITSVTFDKKSRRVGVTNRDGLVQVHLLEGNGKLETVFSVETAQFLPRVLLFKADDEKDVLVAGQGCGNL